MNIQLAVGYLHMSFCKHIPPAFCTRTVLFQLSSGCGFWNLSSPTGGFAYLIPKKFESASKSKE